MFCLALAAGSLHQCIVLTLVLELGRGKEEAGEMAAGAGAPSAGRMRARERDTRQDASFVKVCYTVDEG